MTAVTRRALVIAAIAITAAACARSVDNNTHAAGIRQVTASVPGWVDKTALGKKLWAIEREFYGSREYLPAWVDGDATTPQWKDLIQQLKYAERHGLDPASYGVSAFEDATRFVKPEDLRAEVPHGPDVQTYVEAFGAFCQELTA